MADDTEIFFSRNAVNQDSKSNVLLMFDTSGSMEDPADSTAGPATRMDAVKEATIKLVNDSKNVNIGIGAFAGSGVGGSILYPVVDLDKDACENATCDTVSLKSRVVKPSDDAQQLADGEIVSNLDVLQLGTSVQPDQITKYTANRFGFSDDAEELANGTMVLSNPRIGLFYGTSGNLSHVGYRFVDVQVPPGAHIFDAKIEFRSAAAGRGDMGAQIRIDSTPDSPTFSAAAGEKISERVLLDEVVDWPSIPKHTGANQNADSPDLSELIRARIAEPDWTSGDPMSFILEPIAGLPSNATNHRSFLAAPVLVISYTTEPLQASTVGLRFENVRLPRGATIQHANLRMTGYFDNAAAGDLNIKAQAIGHSPPIQDVDFNLSARAPFTTSITWRRQRYYLADRWPRLSSHLGQ